MARDAGTSSGSEPCWPVWAMTAIAGPADASYIASESDGGGPNVGPGQLSRIGAPLVGASLIVSVCGAAPRARLPSWPGLAP